MIDATRVVIHTQEQAGIDLVCDGELYRFDVNHPQTNGMIEYFVRPMAGIRPRVTFDELPSARRAQPATKFARAAGRWWKGRSAGNARPAAGLSNAGKEITSGHSQVHP